MKMMFKIWDKQEGEYMTDGEGELVVFDTIGEAKIWLNTPDELNPEWMEANFEYHTHFWMDSSGYDY